MDITLEQGLASVVRYVQDNVPEGTAVYFHDIPENFMVPSIYFPVPRTDCRKATLETYLLNLHMRVWFMHSTDWDSYTAAAAVRDGIILKACRIPMVEQDGNLVADRVVRVSEPELSHIDTGIMQLAFKIRIYMANEMDAAKAGEIIFSRPSAS